MVFPCWCSLHLHWWWQVRKLLNIFLLSSALCSNSFLFLFCLDHGRYICQGRGPYNIKRTAWHNFQKPNMMFNEQPNEWQLNKNHIIYQIFRQLLNLQWVCYSCFSLHISKHIWENTWWFLICFDFLVLLMMNQSVKCSNSQAA